jgi:hypothetical protein
VSWEERDGDGGLRAMCDHGAEHRGDKAIKFKCFNRAERDRVHEYMKERHPGVPFFCEWIDFGKDDA